MQYRVGHVTVTNGSNSVVGDVTSFTTNVSAGDLFTVVGSGVTYVIASVTNDNTIVLSVNYAGTTASGASYTISKSFTPNQNLPYVEKGDIETATILKAAFLQLDQSLALDTVITTPGVGNILTYNGTEWINATLAGAAGEVTVTESGSVVTINLPQGLNTTSSPTFANLTLTGDLSISSLSPIVGDVLTWNGSLWVNTLSGGVAASTFANTHPGSTTDSAAGLQAALNTLNGTGKFLLIDAQYTLTASGLVTNGDNRIVGLNSKGVSKLTANANINLITINNGNIQSPKVLSGVYLDANTANSSRTNTSLVAITIGNNATQNYTVWVDDIYIASNHFYRGIQSTNECDMTKISHVTSYGGAFGNAFIFIDGNASESDQGGAIEITHCTAAHQNNDSFGGLNKYGIFVQGVEDCSIRNCIINGFDVNYAIASQSTIGNGQLTYNTLIDSCHSEDFRTFVQDFAVWAASTAYVSYGFGGSRITPTTQNGFVYVATVTGTSGSTQPTWPTSIGATVTDGTVTWQNQGYNGMRWTASKVVATNLVNKPTAINSNGWIYQATTGGTTGTTEPTWTTGYGSTVSDGTVTWTAVNQSVNVGMYGAGSSLAVEVNNSVIGLCLNAFQQQVGLLTIRNTNSINTTYSHSDYSYNYIGSGSNAYVTARNSTFNGNYNPYNLSAATSSSVNAENAYVTNDTIGFLANNARSVNIFSNDILQQRTVLATSGTNQNSPTLKLRTNYWNGSSSQVGGFLIQTQVGTGSNPLETLTLTHSGSSGGSGFRYQGFYVDGGGDVVLTNSNPATSSLNQLFPFIDFVSPYWNGTVGTNNDTWIVQPQFGTGSNPTSTFAISHSGGGTTGSIAIALNANTNVSGNLVVTSTTASTSTTTGSAVFDGGIGVAGAAYAASVYDNGNRVITGVAAGTGISVTGSAPSLTVAASNIPNSALTNSSITVTGGTGLGVSGSPVSLGGTVTLSNTGVTSNAAGTGITVSGATGAVTITNSGVTSITGTTSQVIASASTGGVTLTLPQNIATTSSPTFQNLTLSTSAVATSGANYNSPNLTVNDAYWNGIVSTLGGFIIYSVPSAGTNPLETFTVAHSGSSGGSNYSFASGNFIFNGSGQIIKYNSIPTVGVGMPAILGATSLTAQTANVSPTTITSAPATAVYRVSVIIKVTQAATTSSTLPDVEIIYTDRDTSAVQAVQVTAGASGNTLGLTRAGDLVIDALTGTNIQYAVGQNQAYASSGATVMQFAVRIRLENLG